jgi:predicted transcriptional regulator
MLINNYLTINKTECLIIILSHEYREKAYIIKDIILKLAEYGELNQTALLSYCGLNLAKHKPIIDKMEGKGLISKKEEPWGNKKIIKYTVTPEGLEFCRKILEPYEAMFPRKK